MVTPLAPNRPAASRHKRGARSDGKHAEARQRSLRSAVEQYRVTSGIRRGKRTQSRCRERRSG